MNRMLVAGWSLLLSVCLFTDQLDALLKHRHIHFSAETPQSWWSMLTVSDARFTDGYWLFVKCGHMIGFAMLEWLLLQATGSRRKAALIALAAAAGSELLQLVFGRDGRLLDIGIDALGVALAGVLPAARRKTMHA